MWQIGLKSCKGIFFFSFFFGLVFFFLGGGGRIHISVECGGLGIRKFTTFNNILFEK